MVNLLFISFTGFGERNGRKQEAHYFTGLGDEGGEWIDEAPQSWVNLQGFCVQDTAFHSPKPSAIFLKHRLGISVC